MSNTVTVKTAIITVPNRLINAGEYMGAFGHGKSHVDVLLQYVTPRQYVIEQQEQGENVVVTIEYIGVFGKRNMEEVERFVKHGFIKNISY